MGISLKSMFGGGEVMKKFYVFVFLYLAFALAGTCDLGQQGELTYGNATLQGSSGFGKAPLHFVENMGQINAAVKFQVSIPQGTIYFTSQGLTYQFFAPGKSEEVVQEDNIKLDFVGANGNPRIEGLGKSGAEMNYFLGNNPQEWVTGASSYYGLRYQELYPRIDLLVFGKEGRFKQEYVVKAGGNVEDIRIHYQGVERVQINDKGQLEIFTRSGVVREDAPFSYQLIDGRRVEVRTEYSLDESNTLRFKVGEYRREIDLVIDPELLYSTFLGGNDWDGAFEMHYDEDGYAYITGETWSKDFPTQAGSYDRSYNGNGDAFVTKLGPEGHGRCDKSGLTRKRLCVGDHRISKFPDQKGL